MKPGVLLFQPDQSVTCDINHRESAQNIPKKAAIYNYI